MRRFFQIAAAALLLAPGPATAVSVVYDNTTTQVGSISADLDEFGDEVTLSAGPRMVTEFRLGYFDNFEEDGDETLRIRFYANDGAGGAPGSVLYDETVAVVGGIGVLEAVVNPGVMVPDTFTWTMQFGGMAGTGGDRALLALYNPPTVGSSADFFWFQASGFVEFDTSATDNAYARVTTTPEPAAAALLLLAALGATRMRFGSRADSRS